MQLRLAAFVYIRASNTADICLLRHLVNMPVTEGLIYVWAEMLVVMSFLWSHMTSELYALNVLLAAGGKVSPV